MTAVFVGGSRKISRLNEAVIRRLDNIVKKRMRVLVGDANGADKAVQTYLSERGYENVSVFCTGGYCRNNVGGWPVNRVEPAEKKMKKDRRFFALKDAAMSREATHGLMLWDGHSLGTLVNVVRLAKAGKASAIFVAPLRTFVEVRGEAGLEELGSYCTPDLLAGALQEVESESTAHRRNGGGANLVLF